MQQRCVAFRVRHLLAKSGNISFCMRLRSLFGGNTLMADCGRDRETETETETHRQRHTDREAWKNRYRERQIEVRSDCPVVIGVISCYLWVRRPVISLSISIVVSNFAGCVKIYGGSGGSSSSSLYTDLMKPNKASCNNLGSTIAQRRRASSHD